MSFLKMLVGDLFVNKEARDEAARHTVNVQYTSIKAARMSCTDKPASGGVTKKMDSSDVSGIKIPETGCFLTNHTFDNSHGVKVGSLTKKGKKKMWKFLTKN